MINRRAFLAGLFVAPAIVRATSIMTVKMLPLSQLRVSIDYGDNDMTFLIQRYKNEIVKVTRIPAKYLFAQGSKIDDYNWSRDGGFIGSANAKPSKAYRLGSANSPTEQPQRSLALPNLASWRHLGDTVQKGINDQGHTPLAEPDSGQPRILVQEHGLLPQRPKLDEGDG